MNWDLISEAKIVFEKVLDAPPEDRLSILDSCGQPGSPLRAEVEALLERFESSSSPLEKSLPELLATLQSPALQRLRDYEIIRPLGQGGMGRVYLARKADRLQQREVAIKVINRAFVSSEVDSRFRREVNALSKLSHPNIVQLLDGGVTEDGLLYMVMEYVAGVPIDEYCRGNDLSEQGRLAVFLQLCGAVSYAHRNLIVHRDLKPSNVLVTAEGAVKLLDFGVAKLLDEESAEHFTTAGLNRVTLEYASPEQLSARQPVSTTSDVYSLGVVLYEMLTGRLPYDWRGRLVHEIVATIIEDEPVKPSLSAELTSILLCALRKEPERRYASVDYLKDDIERYCNGLPVRAFRDSAWYRSMKFLRRRWKIATATIAAAVTILAAAGAALYQADRANRRFAEVKQLADEVLIEADALLWGVRGALEARLFIQEMSVRFLGQLVSDAPEDNTLSQRLIYALLRHAGYLSEPEGSHVGKTAEAEKMIQRALALSENAIRKNPKDEVNVGNLTLSHFYLGKNLAERGDPKGALAHFEYGLKLQEDFYRGSANIEAHENLALLQSRLGYQLSLAGERERPVALFNSALAIRQAILDKAAPSWLILKRKRHMSETLHLVAMGQATLSKHDEAIRSIDRAVAIERELLAVNKENVNSRHMLALRLKVQADILRHLHSLPKASASAEESIAIQRSVLADEKGSWGYRRHLAQALNVLASIRLAQGRMDEAVTLLKEQLWHAAALTERDTANLRARQEWLECKAQLAALTANR